MRSAATRRARRLNARRRAIRFFAEHAGTVIGEAALTGYQLALAEEIAEELDWTTEWELDSYPDLSWCEKCQSDHDHRAGHALNTYCAVLRDGDGRALSSLGGIDRPDKAYRRVVEAELALEALAEEHAGPRQSRLQFLKARAEEFVQAAEHLDRLRIAQRATSPHARCADSPTCVEHAHNRRVPSCKRRTGRVRPR